MERLQNLLILVYGVALVNAFQNGRGGALDLGSDDQLATTHTAVSKQLTGIDPDSAPPEDRLLKCVCTDCPGGVCETDGYCFVTITVDKSGEKQISKKHACLDKSKQFPPEHAYKCRGGYSRTVYPRLEEEMLCCRDADLCNNERLIAPVAPPWGRPGQRGGEGKASTSPASPPITRLDSCYQ